MSLRHGLRASYMNFAILYQSCCTFVKKKYIIKQHNQLLNIIDITSVDTYSIKHRQQILKVYGTKRKITLQNW